MSIVSFLVSLSLLLGVLLLTVTTAQALAAMARGLGTWARWPLALLSQALALVPLSVLIWAVVGQWVGQWGLPLSSLMPAAADSAGGDALTRLATWVWWWAPAILLLAAPLTAHLLSSCLVSRRPFHQQVAGLALPAALGLAVAEDAFHLPGALAALLPTLQPEATSSVLGALLPVFLLAGLWACGACAWPRQPEVYQLTAHDQIREGAWVIGLSPEETWRRHLWRHDTRRVISTLCNGVAWGLVLWVALGCPGHPVLAAQFHAAYTAALQTPEAPLLLAWPYVLWALSFGLLARIILPRPR
ncbi:hypothetical protein [Prosthecobacter dejongeii]|uniref:Uncharacterized protein n=1 Tax=Prosthecobacter dejongeii TaxID=48465 RepID=A0A7W7YLW8_9BACT|nr:hypothetical protein [Prosthecobacter dejongeii]MBB5038452.1 hypothetical protein [Prosthecobacter dejongeii]